MSSAPPVTVDIDVAPELHGRVLWVLECLFAVGDVAWSVGVPDGEPDVGYGTAAGRVRLRHDPQEWQFTRTPPRRDPIATAFWWLARVEETLADADDRDEHGRFAFRTSALAEATRLAMATADGSHDGVPALPAPVDDIARQLLEGIDRTPAGYGEGRGWALALTHDIDLVSRWDAAGVRRTVRAAGKALLRGHPVEATRHGAALAAAPLWRARKADPWRNAARIAALEQRHGARSTAYLLAGFHHPADGDAAAHARWRTAWGREFVAAGGAVGLHGSYTSSDTPGRIADERRLLEDELGVRIEHHRFHYLRYAGPAAWDGLAQAGIATDASLGYASHPGFRAGFSCPYRAWSHERDAPLNLLLVPLALMDATFEPRYLGVDPRRAWPHVEAVLGHARAAGSGCSVLWHNDKVAAGRGARHWSALYERLLARAAADGAWLTDTGSLAGHWRERLARGRRRASARD